MVLSFNQRLSWYPLAQMLFDFSFFVVGALIASMWIGSGLPVNDKQLILFALILIATMLAINIWLGLCQRLHIQSINVSRRRGMLSLYLAIPLAYGIFVLLPLATINREFMHLSAMSAVFGMLVNRVTTSRSVSSSLLKRRVMVFGTGARALEVMRALDKSNPSVEIVGFYPSPSEKTSLVPCNQIISLSGSLAVDAQSLKVDEIVVAVTDRRGGSMPLRELLDCRLKGIRVLDLASYYEDVFGKIRLDSLYAGWLVFGDGFRQGLFRSMLKRLSDIVFASILLVLAIPIMLLTAALIMIESGTPVLYRQERVGYNGRLFRVTKFRSMCCDAEKGGKAVWATANDERITRVGRVIRKLRIDELPQLFSILKGEMSLVGPRPERPFFVDQLTREIPFYAVRHSVKPGLTGWAQVRYHYGATIEDSAEKLQYDLYYVKNNSLLLDMVILFETIGVVLTGKGAH